MCIYIYIYIYLELQINNDLQAPNLDESVIVRPISALRLWISEGMTRDERQLLDAVSRHERSEPRYRRQAPRAMGPFELGAACFPSWGPLKLGGGTESTLMSIGNFPGDLAGRFLSGRCSLGRLSVGRLGAGGSCGSYIYIYLYNYIIYIYIYIYTIYLSIYLSGTRRPPHSFAPARRTPPSCLRPVRLLRVWVSKGLTHTNS